TRFSRDWSSDVCSSDLRNLAVVNSKIFPFHWFLAAVEMTPELVCLNNNFRIPHFRNLGSIKMYATSTKIFAATTITAENKTVPRSEERRVGKQKTTRNT